MCSFSIISFPHLVIEWNYQNRIIYYIYHRRKYPFTHRLSRDTYNSWNCPYQGPKIYLDTFVQLLKLGSMLTVYWVPHRWFYEWYSHSDSVRDKHAHMHVFNLSNSLKVFIHSRANLSSVVISWALAVSESRSKSATAHDPYDVGHDSFSCQVSRSIPGSLMCLWGPQNWEQPFTSQCLEPHAPRSKSFPKFKQLQLLLPLFVSLATYLSRNSISILRIELSTWTSRPIASEQLYTGYTTLMRSCVWEEERSYSVEKIAAAHVGIEIYEIKHLL